MSRSWRELGGTGRISLLPTAVRMFNQPVNGSLVPFVSESYAFNQGIIKRTKHSGFFAVFVLLVGIPSFKQRLELGVHQGKSLQATGQPLRLASDYESCPR